MKLNQKGFGAIEGLLVVIALTLIVGVGFYVVSTNKDKKEDTKTTQNSSTPTESKPAEAKKQYLEFKSAGVKIELNEQTKDAYNGTTNEDEVYIGSRVVDRQPGLEGCKVGGSASGIIALSHAKVGDDHFGSPTTEEELKVFSDVKIGDTYYWLTPGNGPCWNPDQIPENDPRIEKLLDFRKSMSDQQKTITKL